jgi:pimeloyl-ACP methyl ester carboxylesterase
MNSQTVSLNGIDLHYQIEGEPLLLLHGGTGSHEDWACAGRDHFIREYKLIKPDARGHGHSSNPDKVITHRQCALDMLALLDHLGISRCRAIGLSMGGNILLHIATLQPQRIDAMIVVSPAMYFPAQAREIMRHVPRAESQSPQVGGNASAPQTRRSAAALWDWTRWNTAMTT